MDHSGQECDEVYCVQQGLRNLQEMWIVVWITQRQRPLDSQLQGAMCNLLEYRAQPAVTDQFTEFRNSICFYRNDITPDTKERGEDSHNLNSGSPKLIITIGDMGW